MAVHYPARRTMKLRRSKDMASHIKLELLASLKKYLPDNYETYSIASGISVSELIKGLGIPEYEVNLIFIDGNEGNLRSMLKGGERVSLSPPLCGG